MKKLNIAALTEDKGFVTLLDKEIERHLKEYQQEDKTDKTTYTRASTENNKRRQQFKSLSFLNKNVVVMKDHRKILFKTHHENIKSMDINKGQFNDLLYSERAVQRQNINQQISHIKVKSYTQQTQRSEIKSAIDEIVQFKPYNTQRATRMDEIQSRIDECKDYLAREKQRLKLAEEQIEKNEILLEQLQDELRIAQSNNHFFSSIKNLDQQIYKNQLNFSNYLKVTQELYQYLLILQTKYFSPFESFSNFIDDFKIELSNILTDYDSLMQLQKFMKQH